VKQDKLAKSLNLGILLFWIKFLLLLIDIQIRQCIRTRQEDYINRLNTKVKDDQSIAMKVIAGFATNAHNPTTDLIQLDDNQEEALKRRTALQYLKRRFQDAQNRDENFDPKTIKL